MQAFAVHHPDGICLFDTGQSLTASPHPGLHPFLRLSRFELGEEDEAARSVDPRAVRWLVLSHLHTDHVGGVAAFSGAEIVVTRGEWEQAAGLRGRLRGYVPHHWPNGVEPRLVDLGPPPIGPFAGSYDVTGDGTLLVVPLPGHTRHHAGLLARGGGRAWLLAGDAAHTAVELSREQPELASWCEENRVVILTAHDPDAERLASASA